MGLSGEEYMGYLCAVHQHAISEKLSEGVTSGLRGGDLIGNTMHILHYRFQVGFEFFIAQVQIMQNIGGRFYQPGGCIGYHQQV